MPLQQHPDEENKWHSCSFINSQQLWINQSTKVGVPHQCTLYAQKEAYGKIKHFSTPTVTLTLLKHTIQKY